MTLFVLKTFSSVLKCSTGFSGILFRAADMYSVSSVEHLQGMQIATQLPPADSKKQFKDAKEDFRDIKMRKKLQVKKWGI